jgi:hypothetical protein
MNAEGQLVIEVIDSLLDDGMARRVLEIRRGWPGFAIAQTRRIWLQFIRLPVTEKNQRSIYIKMGILAHEIFHTLESHLWQAHYRSFELGSYPFNVLGEGVVNLWTEITWVRFLHLLLSDPSVRSQVEERDASAPPLAEIPHPSAYRYPSIRGAFKMLGVISVRNLASAFFGADMTKIIGTLDQDQRNLAGLEQLLGQLEDVLAEPAPAEPSARGAARLDRVNEARTRLQLVQGQITALRARPSGAGPGGASAGPRPAASSGPDAFRGGGVAGPAGCGGTGWDFGCGGGGGAGGGAG